jgi:hypothetical protein
MHQITLGLSLHRPEMTHLIENQMRRHAAIFLEEPPDPNFDQMLSGNLDVDEYLSLLDVEYPVFSRDMCYLMRELHADGKQIFQVEPFWEILLGIHEFFAAGHRPEELQKNTIQYPVYLAERNATRALVSYYQTVVTGSFEDTLKAILQFARMDAARFGMRDSLRAQEIASMVKKYSSAYIEAGMMHYPMRRLLRQQLPKKNRIKVIFLADEVLKSAAPEGHLYSPGDQLTLLYIFHPGIRDLPREKLLAARSIIYSKIVQKEEMTDNLNTFPHLRDELACLRLARLLSLEDCRRLFPLLRRAPSSEAREIVNGYIRKRIPQIKQQFDAEWQRRSKDNDSTALQP